MNKNKKGKKNRIQNRIIYYCVNTNEYKHLRFVVLPESLRLYNAIERERMICVLVTLCHCVCANIQLKGFYLLVVFKLKQKKKNKYTQSHAVKHIWIRIR